MCVTFTAPLWFTKPEMEAIIFLHIVNYTIGADIKKQFVSVMIDRLIQFKEMKRQS